MGLENDSFSSFATGIIDDTFNLICVTGVSDVFMSEMYVMVFTVNNNYVR